MIRSARLASIYGRNNGALPEDGAGVEVGPRSSGLKVQGFALGAFDDEWFDGEPERDHLRRKHGASV